ncbi:hypothetical protein BIW11_00168 [Tropilaelaps mercedesae]|uniref:C2H2-type domain-containing protein n=1 Tax=Tropilaelaps mercedesae TaxID=418985 RepID=A0A1V9Y0N9_9ACAR|nr:hypothetical protein BIW11_00168 [Tropilaelaps mercedesae]
MPLCRSGLGAIKEVLPSGQVCHFPAEVSLVTADTCQETSAAQKAKLPGDEGEVGQENNSVSYICAFCEQRIYSSQEPVTEHEAKHYLLVGKFLACSLCRSEFTTWRDIVVHVRSHFSVKAFKCRFCDYQTNRHFNMKVHLRTHTDERPFACGSCDRSFRRKYSLNHHITRYHPNFRLMSFPYEYQTHYQVRPTSAIVSLTIPHSSVALDSKWLEQPSLYSSEYPTITDDRSDGADQEGLLFSTDFREASLPSKLLVNSCEEFKCRLCNYRSNFKHNLKRHILTHTGEVVKYFIRTDERPFACKFCGKTLRTTCHLRRHEAIHMRAYNCHLCTLSFEQRSRLLAHVASQHVGPDRARDLIDTWLKIGRDEKRSEEDLFFVV